LINRAFFFVGKKEEEEAWWTSSWLVEKQTSTCVKLGGTIELTDSFRFQFFGTVL